jgi:hypothetical protein
MASFQSGIGPYQTMIAYLGGSLIQTVVDNPLTAYRQLVQQYAKDLSGKLVDPKVATAEATAVFRRTPLTACLSGLGPRIIGIGFKRVPKFGSLLAISYVCGTDETPGLIAATVASLVSAPFINPIRMIEKQQRAYLKQTGMAKPMMDILRESAVTNHRPLFRGTVPLMGHSLASATLGLVGQPQLEQYIKHKLGGSEKHQLLRGLVASAVVSPMYVIMTNPLSRMEVIMQTASIQGKSVRISDACKEVFVDSRQFGVRGLFRGQGLGIAKAIVSLTVFHQGRLGLMGAFQRT